MTWDFLERSGEIIDVYETSGLSSERDWTGGALGEKRELMWGTAPLGHIGQASER